jgi:hypothetical protein
MISKMTSFADLVILWNIVIAKLWLCFIKLSIVPCATGPENWGHLRTAYGYQCQAASQVSLFDHFSLNNSIKYKLIVHLPQGQD